MSRNGLLIKMSHRMLMTLFHSEKSDVHPKLRRKPKAVSTKQGLVSDSVKPKMNLQITFTMEWATFSLSSENSGCLPSLCCEGINAEISTPGNLSVIFSGSAGVEMVEEEEKEQGLYSGNGWKEAELLFWLCVRRTNFEFQLLFMTGRSPWGEK